MALAQASSVTAISMAERKPIIAGNWKMNPTTIAEAVELGNAIKAEAAGCTKAEVRIAALDTHYMLVADEEAVLDPYVGHWFDWYVRGAFRLQGRRRGVTGLRCFIESLKHMCYLVRWEHEYLLVCWACEGVLLCSACTGVLVCCSTSMQVQSGLWGPLWAEG